MVAVHKGADQFRGERAWQALDVAVVDGASVRVHWSDEPYIWHVNDGPEVFAVLNGVVEMKYRADGQTKSVMLEAGDIFYAGAGDEHVAHPKGEARILVIERQGSI